MEATRTIPGVLVYEKVAGKPIYYKNYRDYLSGKKQLEELMGSSYLQSNIVSLLLYELMSSVGKKHKVLSNELGLQLGKSTTRSADIAIVSKDKLKAMGSKDKKKYMSVPPDVVIEVDIKADTEGQHEFSYINTKTEQLFAFGVAKVIWILTDAEKIIVAASGAKWEIVSWKSDIEVIGDCSVNLDRLLREG